MTTPLIIIAIIGVFLMGLVGTLILVRAATYSPESKYTQSECIAFAQSVTNLEVTIEDFEQWLSHEGRQIRFSDN